MIKKLPIFVILILTLSCNQKSDIEKASIYFSRGENLLQQNKWEKAGKEFQKAMNHNPFFKKAHEKYQDVEYYYFEKKDEIIQEYQKLNEDYPNNPLFPYLLGRITKWDSDEKLNLLKKSIELDSTFIPAYRELLGNLLFSQKYDEAYKILKTGLKYCPNSIEILFSQAGYLRKMGEIEKLKQTYYSMIKQFPDSSQIAWVYRGLANLTDDQQEKIHYLENVLNFDISNRMPFVYSGLLRLYEHYDSTKVVPLARKAISVVPPIEERRVPSNGYHFLYRYYLKHDTLKAIELAYELFESKNQDPDLYTRIANNLLKIGKEIPLAINLIKKSIQLNKPENVFGLRYFGRASYTGLKENAEKQQAYFLSSLGWAYYQNGEYEKAIETLNSASGIAEWAEAKIYDRLGQTYEKLEQWENAIKAYSKSLSYEENDRIRKALVNFSSKTSLEEIHVPQKKSINIDSLIIEAQLAEAIEAPDFTLKNMNGEKVALKDYRGKVVLLDFWASWCGPCIAELPYLQKLMKSYENNSSVIFLTISTDIEPEVVKKFVKENNYTFPVLMNNGTSIQYNVKGIPVLFIIDQNGFIRYRHLGYNSNVDFEKLMSKEINMLLSS